MDREKVIKESEEAIDILAKAEEPTFWMDFVRCAFENALALLKEQEAKKINIWQAHCGMKYGLCPKCGEQVDTLVNPNYCGYCGQAVKWE